MQFISLIAISISEMNWDRVSPPLQQVIEQECTYDIRLREVTDCVTHILMV